MNSFRLLSHAKSCLLNLQTPNFLVPVRYARRKHWNPKYKKDRARKVIKVDLSFYDNNDTEEEHENRVRKKMKEKGIYPQAPWIEKPIFMASTSSIFESYVPPEGDGKYSFVTAAGTKQNVEFVVKKGKSHQAVKRIKSFEEEFDVKEFPSQALDIYIKAHNALAANDLESLTDYVTEKVYPEMIYNIDHRRIVWKFVQSLAPAKVVHARCTSLLTDQNHFGQVTVRFYTQQILAVYDRFGRLMSGSPILKKDVLEYAVFEKHLSNAYGKWRLHGKIIPDWLPKPEPAPKTYCVT